MSNLKSRGRNNEPYVTNPIKYSVFNGSNFKFYFNLLIEISSNNFLNTSLDFQKRIAIFEFYSKMLNKNYEICQFILENRFSWEKITFVLTIFGCIDYLAKTTTKINLCEHVLAN